MSEAYKTLEDRFRRMNAISGSLAMLGWDRSVMMPAGGAEARSEQMATLSVMLHELRTAADIGDLLDQTEESQELDEWQSANVREMRRGWIHATAVPGSLVEKMSRASATSEMAWRSARAEDNFAALVAPLEEVLGLTREMASAKAEAMGVNEYDALLDSFDPGRTSAQIDVIFEDLLSFLPDMVDEIIDRQKLQPPSPEPMGPFDVGVQEKIGRTIIETLGFDFNSGRLDVSLHPFSGGIPDDSRITTRYEESDFSTSLMGLVHETGHSLYERGLPKPWRNQPVGRARGMTLHESQSLLYEMQAARSPEFVSYIAPLLRKAFNGTGDGWNAESLTRQYHTVKRDLIRVNADEASYPLHVILRYRLERAMVSGDLEIKDLPEAWNAAMSELLGVVPKNDSDGCMQDIHWPSGAFGYFPTYTLGALAAAQIFATIKSTLPDIMEQIGEGNFTALNTWLGNHIHGQGCLVLPNELIKQATGGPLGTAAFKSHLKERYLPL